MTPNSPVDHIVPQDISPDGLRPRIAPLAAADLDDEAVALATKLRAAFGLTTDAIPQVMATMIRHPALYRAQVDYFTRRAEVLVGDARLREIAILRMSWLCRSGYLWGEHVRLAKKVGLNTEDIERITRGGGDRGWTRLEAALIGAVDDLRRSATVGDADWAVLAAEISEKELIELLVVIGDHQEAASIYNALRVELLPGNRGLSER